MDKTALCFWFDGKAEEAARFYADTFPDTRVLSMQAGTEDWPGGKAGDVISVEFTLLGRAALGLNGGPGEDYGNAMSVQVYTEDQAETDRYWASLTAGGGSEMACGWCRDRFGVPWQIVPRCLIAGVTHPDDAVRARVNAAMYQMVKIDHAAIEAAIEGN